MNIRNILTALLLCPLLSLTSASFAATVTLDLTSGGNAGPSLDSSGGGSVLISGVTIAATATNGDVNSLANSLGIDGPSDSDSDQIESATSEALDLAFSFGAGTMVTFVSVNMTGVGAATSTDGAFIALNSTPFPVLKTGATDFNGSSDTWTPSGGISLSSGDVFSFTAEDSYGLEEIVLEVTQVPEPVGTVLCLLALAGSLATYRQR